VFAFASPAQRRMIRAARLFVRALAAAPRLRGWLIRKLLDTPDMRVHAEAERERFAAAVLATPPATMLKLLDGAEGARPAGGDRLERCWLVVCPDDPALPEEVLLRALGRLGFPDDKVFRLAGGGHFPVRERESRPEWRARNLDDLVGIVDGVVEATRQAGPPPPARTVRRVIAP
jgi:hypothetical protein